MQFKKSWEDSNSTQKVIINVSLAMEYCDMHDVEKVKRMKNTVIALNSKQENHWNDVGITI